MGEGGGQEEEERAGSLGNRTWLSFLPPGAFSQHNWEADQPWLGELLTPEQVTLFLRALRCRPSKGILYECVWAGQEPL